MKRIVDVLLCGLALLLLWPLMLATALAIRLEDGAPILFHQRRVGRDGQLFYVLKFRSLPVNTGDIPSAMAAEIRPTRVGGIIRRLNIDELPQLWNILRGEMSLVGPRPPLPAQKELCRLRHTNGAIRCQPGLTGLAQIKAYDGMPETEKARLDGEYAAHVSFRADALIILRTFGYLAKRPPVY